jgi:flagellar biogenesis protein FliO
VRAKGFAAWRQGYTHSLRLGQKPVRPEADHEQGIRMSRSSLFLILILALIVAGAIWLTRIDTQVAPVRVEKAVLNEAQAQ